MPLISILSAAYAPSAKYLGETVASVQAQALPDGWELEWIVQEDGPNPSLSDQLRADDRIKYGANGTQLGIAATRNLALSRAAGDLVQVLDHDDILLPGALATMVPAFDNKRVHWAIGQADDLMPGGSRKAWDSALPFGVVPAGDVNAWAEAHGANWPIHCAGLSMRTASVRAIGGWAGLPYDDDVSMFAALSEIADGYNEPTVTWLYRQHEAQVTRTASHELWSADMRRIALQRALSISAAGLCLDNTSAIASDKYRALHTLEIGPPLKGQ